MGNILEYIYNGEIKINEEDLERFLEVAKRFKLDGLTLTENIKFKNQSSPKKEAFEQIDSIHSLGDESRFLNDSLSIAEKEDNLKFNMKVDKNSSQNKSPFLGNFSDIAELDKTIDENIFRDEDGFFRCSKCPKVNKNRTHLREHIEGHIEGLSFPCKNCDKILRTRHSLRTHNSKVHN